MIFVTWHQKENKHNQRERPTLFIYPLESLITARLPVIKLLILEMDTRGRGSTKYPAVPPPISLVSLPPATFSHSQALNVGVPLGIQVAVSGRPLNTLLLKGFIAD